MRSLFAHWDGSFVMPNCPAKGGIRCSGLLMPSAAQLVRQPLSPFPPCRQASRVSSSRPLCQHPARRAHAHARRAAQLAPAAARPAAAGAAAVLAVSDSGGGICSSRSRPAHSPPRRCAMADSAGCLVLLHRHLVGLPLHAAGLRQGFPCGIQPCLYCGCRAQACLPPAAALPPAPLQLGSAKLHHVTRVCCNSTQSQTK